MNFSCNVRRRIVCFIMLFARRHCLLYLLQRKPNLMKHFQMTCHRLTTDVGSNAKTNAELAEKYTINRTDIHHKLIDITSKHILNFDNYKNSNIYAQHTINSFREATDFVDEFYSSNQTRQSNLKTVILDSGCGVGFSTLQLARKFPQYPIIGIDRSIHRLEKNKAFQTLQQDDIANTPTTNFKDENPNLNSGAGLENVLLIRAELSDFWMLAAEQSNWIVHSHYILYPNPYPKNKHILRRWHAHPCLPALLVLGGRLTVRSNWAVYCEEMRRTILEVQRLQPALLRTGTTAGVGSDASSLEETLLVEEESPGSEAAFDSPTTHFEMKYRRVGVPLFQLNVQLGLRNADERNALLSLLTS